MLNGAILHCLVLIFFELTISSYKFQGNIILRGLKLIRSLFLRPQDGERAILDPKIHNSKVLTCDHVNYKSAN